MPCYDGRNSYSSGFEDGMSAAQHNSPVAEMLCSICREEERLHHRYWKGSGVFDIPGVRDWWKAHQERDAAKAKQEAEFAKQRRKLDEAEFAKLAKRLGRKV